MREEWQADPRNPGNPGDPEHRHRHPVPGKGSPSFTATWSNRTESEGFFSPQRCPRRWGPSRSLGSYAAEEYDRADSDLEKMHDAKPGDWHWHVALWKDTSQSWVKFSSCMFKCVARGTMNLLEACGYLAVGTLYSGYADAWAFWAIQILFTVINIMIVHFLLDSFEPSNIKSDWLIWLLRRHPFVVACIVASGPLFCVIAAATSWVIFDRFLIPLCYGTHTFVNIYFVSMFTTDEEVQERHHDSDSENDQEGDSSGRGSELGTVGCPTHSSFTATGASRFPSSPNASSGNLGGELLMVLRLSVGSLGCLVWNGFQKLQSCGASLA